jgi:hypothetical protein
MISFRELLTASDSDLVRIFYKIKSDPAEDFIIRINKVAAQLGLNHTQLVCALGFNKHIRELTDILSVLGFKSYKLLSYRNRELFSNDIYKQLSIENVIDIYSEHLEDPEIFATLRDLLKPRLGNLERAIAQGGDPTHSICYRMEVHAIYTAGLATKEFAEERLSQDIGQYRLLASEVNVIVETGLIPPSNMFFMDSLLPEEKRLLIENQHINKAMIANRLKNPKLSDAERELLEQFA